MEPKNYFTLALDVSSLFAAKELVNATRKYVGYYKIGKQLINAVGLRTAIRGIKDLGVRVFVDIKEHDIPNTVERAVEIAATCGADIINVHCSGGLEMMAKAARTVKVYNQKVKVVGVSVLTSMNDTDMQDIGCMYSPAVQVCNLAWLARKAGLDGLICSPEELPLVRSVMGPDAFIITPGIRPWGNNDDQKRISSPYQAILNGASTIVVGRPVTSNPDRTPEEAASLIYEEIASALEVANANAAHAKPQTLKKFFIELLIEANAIKTGEFQLKNGGTSHVYINIRELANNHNALSMAVFLMKLLLVEEGITFDRVGGVPMGALTLANMLSFATRKPVLTLRQEAKDHGIAGTTTVEPYTNEQRVLPVEDVATTAGSLCDAIEKYRGMGLTVDHAIVVVDRLQGGSEKLEQMGVTLHSLITIRDIAEFICNKDNIDESIKNYMRQFLA